MRTFKKFILSEAGDVAEYMIRLTIITLGGTAILFGVLEALRYKGGVLIEHINNMDL